MIDFTALKSRAKKTPFHLLFFYLLILFLPTQLGMHFWPSWTYVNGLKIDYLSPTIYFTDILLFLMLTSWFFSIRKNAKKIIKNNLKTIIILLLITSYFLLLTSCFLNPFVHVFKFLKLFELFLLFLYIKNNVSVKQFNNITIILSLGIIFESSLTLGQYFMQSSLGGIFYWFGERTFNNGTPGIAQAIINGKLILRPYGTFPHPNVLAGYFLVTYFLILYFYKLGKHNKTIKLFVILNSYLLILTLFLSFSRSVWIVSGIAFFFIGVPNLKKIIYYFKEKKLLLFALIFALYSLVFVLISPVKDRIISLGTTDKQSISRRINLNNLAFKMWISSPIIGVGLNNFIPNIPKFTQKEPEVRFYQPVHNIYLLILSESGLLGLSLFLWFIIKTLKNIFLNRKSYLLNPFVIILFLGFFDHYFITIQQTQLLFVLVIGLIWNKQIKTSS